MTIHRQPRHRNENHDRNMDIRRRRLWPATIAATVGLLGLTLMAPYAHAAEDYTVKAGDTLSAIAAMFHVSVQALAQRNHIVNPDLIDTGETLIIPDAGFVYTAPKAGGWEANHALVASHLTLGAAIERYAQSRADQFSVAVWNLTNGHHLTYQPALRYDTASIVKVAIMATLLHQETLTSKPLTQDEQSLMSGMIEDSVNNDATALWNDAGQAPAIQHFMTLAGMKHTIANTLGYWGLTETTAPDQVTLLDSLVKQNKLLGSAERAYALHLMENVVPYEAWGVTSGPAEHAKVALKNGWLPINNNWQDWAINSVGIVRGNGRDYLIAILSADNPSEAYGIASVQQISRYIWQALKPTASS